MGKQNATTKAVIAIILICVAGFFIYKYGMKENPGASPKKTTFVCSSCRHRFEINTRDMTKLQEENPDKNGMIKCPECGAFKALPALRCPHCKKYYLLMDCEDRYSCPHCGKRASEK